MPAHYSIIRYVPDPIADERINVGVVVLDEDGAQVRFLRRWDRVSGFAEGDVKFLKAFAHDLEDRQRLLSETHQAWTVEQLTTYAAEWRHSIQFSEPHASLKPAAELMEEVARRFLIDDVTAVSTAYRTRRTAAKLASQAVRTALRERFGKKQAMDFLKEQYAIEGAGAPHHFDVVMASNGHPRYLRVDVVIEQRARHAQAQRRCAALQRARIIRHVRADACDVARIIAGKRLKLELGYSKAPSRGLHHTAP